AALTLAFSPTLWTRAVEAEVYALNALLVTVGVWLAVRWLARKLSPARALPLFGLLTGVAMASHLTLGALAFLALPPLLRRPRPTWRAWLWGLGLGLAGLALYLYIPLRWPALTGEWMSPGAFVRFVLNADSGGALRPLAFWQDPARWGLVFERVYAQVGWAGLALALLGWLRLLRKQWPLALGSLLAAGAWVWFALSFYVADPDYSAFLIPAHVILIFWMGVGIEGIANGECRIADERIGGSANERISGAADQRMSAALSPQPSVLSPQSSALSPQPSVLSPQSSALSPQSSALSRQSSVLSPQSSALSPQPSVLSPQHFFLIACALLPLSRLWLTGPTLDTRAQGLADEAWGRYALRQPLAEGAAILADSEKFPPLYYLQQVTGLRPDLELVTLFSEEQYRADLEARLSAGQRVYLARYLPGLDAFGVTSAGPLVEVAPPAALTESQYAGPAFNDALILAAHHLEADPEGRPLHHLTLTWNVLARPDTDLTIRLQLRDTEGNIVWEKPATRPVNGYTTTSAWKPNQEVQDYHALAWPDWLPGGRYALGVGVFPRFAEAGWTVASGHTWYPLEMLTLPEQPPAIHRSAASGYFSTPALWLEAAELPGEAWAGASVALEVQWQGTLADDDARPLFRWMPLDAAGAERVTSAATVARPAPGESVRRYVLNAPTETGRYRLDIGWETAGTLSAARCDWLQKTQTFCPLGEINVGPSNAGLANFADQVLLVDAAFNVDDVPAGGQARVDLRWRGLRTLTRDYTVFVQVVGPDGQLYGQVDSWPMQGTRPTSGWRVGEELDDPYRFYLKENLPPGNYMVVVGWYLLADMSRLPLLDAEGQACGDFYTIGEFTMGGESP
ncbi:MAG TPA: DUF2723 domain-containing protein, partial [Anaerolineae bacterium]|nr:DUF2723 domain-containing protein [Anaerolineae bacterium]